MFEGEEYWYYIDEEGEKHFIAWEYKRKWVAEAEAEGQADERWEALEEEVQKSILKGAKKNKTMTVVKYDHTAKGGSSTTKKGVPPK